MLLERRLRSEDKVFFTRFGDNDIYMISGTDNLGRPLGSRRYGGNRTRWSITLQEELRDCLAIRHPNFLKAVSLSWDHEPGMKAGVLAPFECSQALREKVRTVTTEIEFLLPVLFQYLFCFQPEEFRRFIDEHIRPASTLFVGSAPRSLVENVIGTIDYYVNVPATSAYDSIEKWYPQVDSIVRSGEVQMIIPNAGQATRVLNKRLWSIPNNFHSIDMGSVFDAYALRCSRTWIKKSIPRIHELYTTDSACAESPRIYTHIAYAEANTKNLGSAYNEFMELLRDDDWACFLDHDAMFTTRDWYHQLVRIVVKYPNAGMFTAKTNRVHNKAQLFGGKTSDDHDMRNHRKIGRQLACEYYDKVTPLSRRQAVSGVLMLISKRAWKQCRFIDGFLGVDNQMHRDLLDAGMQVYVMEGVYVYHWYRGDGDCSHLISNKKFKKNHLGEQNVAGITTLGGHEENGLNRDKIINLLVSHFGYKEYLEIGFDNPNRNFNRIRCIIKTSVDNKKASQPTHRMSSDQFFVSIPAEKSFDLIFIDGLHEYEQVLRDVKNSLALLNSGGAILLHDCNPPTAWHQRSYQEYQAKRGHWNGTVWQAFVDLRSTREDLEMFVVDTDWGVGLIRRGTQKLLQIPDVMDYEVFAKNREEALNLISCEAFFAWLTAVK